MKAIDTSTWPSPAMRAAIAREQIAGLAADIARRNRRLEWCGDLQRELDERANREDRAEIERLRAWGGLP